MKLILMAFGGRHDANLAKAIDDYTKRLSHYFPAEWELLHAPKQAARLDAPALMDAESEIVLSTIGRQDVLVLLDEKGKMMSSPALSAHLQKHANEGTKRMIFLIGGAFGVNDAVYQRANFVWKLSDLVFPHQLVRLIIAEQIYRAGTILRGEKYHHY